MMFNFGRSQMKNEEEITNIYFVLPLYSPPALAVPVLCTQGIFPCPVRSPTQLLPLLIPLGSTQLVNPTLCTTLQLPRALDWDDANREEGMQKGHPDYIIMTEEGQATYIPHYLLQQGLENLHLHRNGNRLSKQDSFSLILSQPPYIFSFILCGC